LTNDVHVQVTKILDIGAVIELPGGKTALIHISELSVEPVTTITSVVNVDDLVDVMIISADPRKTRASMAALMREKLGLPAISKGRGRGLDEMGRGGSQGRPVRVRGGPRGSDGGETETASFLSSSDEGGSSGLYDKYSDGGRGSEERRRGPATRHRVLHESSGRLQEDGGKLEVASATDSDDAGSSVSES
jgi:hypothetical protein